MELVYSVGVWKLCHPVGAWAEEYFLVSESAFFFPLDIGILA